MPVFNIELPSFSRADLTDEKRLKRVENYLVQLTEQLRFTLNNMTLQDFVDEIDGSMIKAGSIGDDKLYSRYLLAESAHMKYATIEKLIADDGYLRDLRADVLNAKTAILGDVQTRGLQAEVANIMSIMAGNIGTGSLQSLVINSQNAHIENGTIKSAMIESINTSEVEVSSVDGKLKIVDNTIQIKDSNRVRVQIGKDASGDYNLYVWDAAGNLMFDAAGLHEAGIKNPIIRDDMVAPNANIKASKIFVEDGEGGEKLNIVLAEMGEDVGSLQTTVTLMNGLLQSVISSSDIEDFEEGETFYSRYSAFKQSYDSFSSTVSQSITDLNGQMSSVQSSITQLADEIDLKVSKDGVISAINLSPEGVKIQGDKIDILGNAVFSDLTGTVAGQTVIKGSRVRTGTIQSTNGVSRINLDDGTFNFGDGKLVYNGSKLTVVGELSGNVSVNIPVYPYSMASNYKMGYINYFDWDDEVFNYADIHRIGLILEESGGGLPFNLFVGTKIAIDSYDGAPYIGDFIETTGALSIKAPLAIILESNYEYGLIKLAAGNYSGAGRTEFSMDGYGATLTGNLNIQAGTLMEGGYRVWHGGNLRVATGAINITPSAANTPASVNITFPSGRFTSTPRVFCTAITSYPGSRVVEVSANNITTSGCSIWLYRTDTATTTVHWLAIQI